MIAFGDEEGSRFPSAMLASRAVAGTLDAAALEVADANGMRLGDDVDLTAFLTAARSPGDTIAYLEAHIEQGPSARRRPARSRHRHRHRGAAALRGRGRRDGWARRDDVDAVAPRRADRGGDDGLAVEAVAGETDDDLVATVGRLNALPGAANVVPGKVRFTLDVRAGDADRRDRAAAAILDRFRAIAAKRGLDLTVDPIHDLPASPCDPDLMALLDAATTTAGQPVRRLVSGAGHDAMVMAALCPMAMLFIRCKDGISHNPAEHVDPADVDVALRVMLGFIERLGTVHGR